MENILGTYQCVDCSTEFEITSSSIVEAYDGWVPTCPTCGTQNDIQQIAEPQDTQ